MAKHPASHKHYQFQICLSSAQCAGDINALPALSPCVSCWPKPMETNAQDIAERDLEIGPPGHRAEEVADRVDVEGKTENIQPILLT